MALNEPDRVNFYFAVKQIERRLSMSVGAAQAKLREFCASGVVRSWKEPYSMVGVEPQGEGPWEQIEPSEWRSREIDLMTDSDGCQYFVEVSESDLEDQLPPLEKPKLQPFEKPKNSLRDEAILKRLKAGERPGETNDLQWKTFRQSIRQDCGKTSTERGFSDVTIEKVTRKILRSFRS